MINQIEFPVNIVGLISAVADTGSIRRTADCPRYKRILGIFRGF